MDCWFLPHDAMLAQYMLLLCVRPSMRLSVTRLSSMKMLNLGSRKQRDMMAQER